MKNTPFYIILMLALVSKTIEEPIFLNVSPADILWPLAALAFCWCFAGSSDFRKRMTSQNVWLAVVALFFWGMAVSVLSGAFNTPDGLTSEAFLKSFAMNNLKSLLITGYFTLGLWAATSVNPKRFQIVTWISTLLFSSVGLNAFFTGTPEWAMGGGRIISTVNDPNVAAWVCLIGLLMVWALVSERHEMRKAGHQVFKGLVLISVPVFILTLLMTGSRTGLVGLALLGTLLLLTLMRTGRRAVLLISALLLMGAGLIHFDHTALEGQAYAQISSRLFNGTENASDFRGLLREAAMDMGMDHPLIGVGTGQFPNFSTPYFEALGEDITTEHFETTISPKVPHNTYVTFFAERGVVGAGLFLLLIGLSIMRAQSGPEYGFTGLLILYSLFFNIENIRFVWFFWGGLACFQPEVMLSRKNELEPTKSWKRDGLLAVTFLLAVLIFVDAAGQLYRIGAELTGQKVEIIVDESGLDMTLQMTGLRNDPLLLSFEGPEERDVIIRNAYNHYYDHYDLAPGTYTLTLNSGARTKKLNHLRLQSGDVDLYVHGRLLHQWGLGVERMDPVYFDLFHMDTVQTYVAYEPVLYESVSIKYMHRASGINFENQINLVNSSLKSLEESSKYEMTWTFEKTGAIEYPYMLLARAYDLRDSRRGHAKDIAENITFDPPLTDLEVGDRFTATWTFDTENRPYMIQYGIYYKDPETGEVTRPYPKWVRQGYIK